MSETTERVQLAGSKMRERRARMKASRFDKRDKKLRAQVDALRSELERLREGREEMLDMIRAGRLTTKRGGTLRLITVAGIAYLLGAKAGRERYAQIVAWGRRMRDDGMRTVRELRNGTDDGEVTVLTAPDRAPTTA